MTGFTDDPVSGEMRVDGVSGLEETAR